MIYWTGNPKMPDMDLRYIQRRLDVLKARADFGQVIELVSIKFSQWLEWLETGKMPRI